MITLNMGPVKSRKISAAVEDNTTIPGVTDRRLLVLSMFFIVGGVTAITFEDGTGGTALTGAMSFADESGLILPFNKAGWFTTSAGNLLNMTLSVSLIVTGSITYQETL